MQGTGQNLSETRTTYVQYIFIGSARAAKTRAGTSKYTPPYNVTRWLDGNDHTAHSYWIKSSNSRWPRRPRISLAISCWSLCTVQIWWCDLWLIATWNDYFTSFFPLLFCLARAWMGGTQGTGQNLSETRTAQYIFIGSARRGESRHVKIQPAYNLTPGEWSRDT